MFADLYFTFIRNVCFQAVKSNRMSHVQNHVKYTVFNCIFNSILNESLHFADVFSLKTSIFILYFNNMQWTC